MRRKPRAALIVLASLALFGAACSSSVSSSGGKDRPTGTLNVATGVDVNLDDCPSTWSDTGGITDDEIRIGMSVPRSGPLADVGGLADGAKAYFDHINKTKPIDGKKVVLDIRDDAYDPAKTKTNVQDMISSGKIFAFLYLVGTANNRAAQPLVEQACIPSVLTGTGELALTAHPDRHPWTQDGILSYNSEASLWCDAIEQRWGKGTTVAALAMDNDFGNDYMDGLKKCAEDGVIKIATEQRHAPTAPGITNQLTTMEASKADVAILATTSSFCPQALSSLAASAWDPHVLLSATCSRVNSTFQPIDPAGAGTLVLLDRKDASDANYADDQAVKKAVQILKDADVMTTGRPFDGVLQAMYLEYALRTAKEMEGGLTRTNLLKVMWNSDFKNPLAVEGITYRTDGTKDPLLFDTARLATYKPPQGSGFGRFEFTGDVLSVNGAG